MLPTACDKADGPTSILTERPVISEFSVNPSAIRFTENDGIRDTLITFHVTVKSAIPENFKLMAALASSRNRNVLAQTELGPDEDRPDHFSGSLALIMNTTRFENLVIYVYPVGSDGRIADRRESVITVRSFDTGMPEVLEIMHPDVVIIPQTGQPANQFFIAAKVSHSVSIDYISSVRLELFDSANQRIFAENMLDNQPDYGTVPGDSIFVQNFSINSGNSPENYTIKVHAIDIVGTASDTLSSTLIITR